MQTLRDRIEAPKYERVPKEEWVSRFRVNSFALAGELSGAVAVNKYSNIRNILAPFYAYPKSEFSHILFGDSSSYKLLFQKVCV